MPPDSQARTDSQAQTESQAPPDSKARTVQQVLREPLDSQARTVLPVRKYSQVQREPPKRWDRRDCRAQPKLEDQRRR